MTTEQFAVAGPVTVEVRVAGGELSIRTAENGDARVSLSGPERLLDATRVSLTGQTLSIRQEKEKSLLALLGGGDLRGLIDGSLQIDVVVPTGSSLDLTTASANAQLTGRFGRVTAKSASGAVTVAGEVNDDITVRNVSGDVDIAHARANVRYQSVSGALSVARADGSVTAASVSGDVALGALSAGTVQIQSVSGDIELGVARGSELEVDANSSSGELASEVELSDRRDSSAGEPAGLVVIRVRTVSGNVHIRRAPEREATSV